MTTIRISFPKLRKQSRSSVSFDIMPKTATYNQCYLVQAAKRYILRTSMERIKYGPSWSQALVQTDLHVEEVVAWWQSLNKEFEFTLWHCGRQGGKFKSRIRFQIMALWKARGEVKIKRQVLDHGIVEGKGGKSLNKEFDFRSWHSGRQGGEV